MISKRRNLLTNEIDSVTVVTETMRANCLRRGARIDWLFEADRMTESGMGAPATPFRDYMSRSTGMLRFAWSPAIKDRGSAELNEPPRTASAAIAESGRRARRDPRKDCRDRSTTGIRSAGRSSTRALFATCHAAGRRSGYKARPTRPQREREAQDAKRKAETREKAALLWQAARLAPVDHGYLLKKGVKAHGLRVHEGALVIRCGTVRNCTDCNSSA